MTPEQEREINNLLHAYKVSLLMDPTNADKTFFMLINACILQAENAAWNAAKDGCCPGDGPFEHQYNDIDEWREEKKQEEAKK